MPDRAAQEMESRYRMLIQTMLDGFVSVDMTGRIVDFNAAYVAMLGYSPAELRQKTYIDLTPEKWHAIEEDIVQRQILRRGYSEIYEKEYRRADGTLLPVELRTLVIRDEAGQPVSMWAIVREISERKRCEIALRELNESLEQRIEDRTAALRESESRFRQLAEASTEGIAISSDGVLVDGNTQLSVMLGYNMSELIGRPISDFVAPNSREEVVRRIKEGRDDIYENHLLRKDGTTVLVESHARTVTRNGRRIRISALRDITATRKAEHEMKAARREAARFLRLAEFSEFSLGVIHELGQPLTAATTNASVVKAKVDACNVQKCCTLCALDEVVTDLKRCREIINRLRALAHPEEMHRKPVNLNGIVRQVVGLMRGKLGHRGARVVEDLAVNLPDVLADEVQMRQVMVNLLHNAIDAVAGCPEERRLITVSTCEIEGGRVEVQWKDLGVGIEEEHLPMLFDPFFTTKADGMGVGLRLAQTIVKAHNGVIEGFNNPNGFGATFRVALPHDGGNP